MYFNIGRPKLLSALQIAPQNMAALKKNNQIAVIDDQPFQKANALRNHKFNIIELGDITSVDQVAEYPIVVCDIRGVGKSLSSTQEGAHLLAEIRKAYPDKYLVSYSGAQFDITYNESLRKADRSIAKDASTEEWVQVLEHGIRKISNPRERWLRLRKHLLEQEVEIFEIFNLEQNFITAIEKRDASQLKANRLPPEVRHIVAAFAKIALIQIIHAITS